MPKSEITEYDDTMALFGFEFLDEVVEVLSLDTNVHLTRNSADAWQHFRTIWRIVVDDQATFALSERN